MYIMNEDSKSKENKGLFNKVIEFDKKTDEVSLIIAKIAIPIAIVYMIYRLIF